MRVLKLNADFRPVCAMPLSTVTWQEAMRLIYQDKAFAISWYDKEVHTTTLTLKVPAVIVLSEYKKPRFKVSYNKYNVKLRDSFTCVYCKRKFHPKDLTLDHVKPKSLKGKASWTNMVASCAPCNGNKKADATIVPQTMPIKPTYEELLDRHYKHTNYIAIDNPHWIEYL